MTIQRRRRAEGDQQERPDISIEPKTKVWVEYSGRFIMGDSGLHLLRAIRARGSLTLAAREVGWSYRHAWEYIRRAERVVGRALTGAVPGKGTNRGTALTDYGVTILKTLTALRARVDRAVGATGPTAQEIASRGRAVRRAPAATSRGRARSSSPATQRSKIKRREQTTRHET